MSSRAGSGLKGSALYKKTDGVFSITDDRKSIIWTPSQPPDAAPAITIAITNISNLQQTPETNPKVILKIFEKPPGGTEATPAITHLFHFNSPKAPREEANAIKEVLSCLLVGLKANDPSVSKVNGHLPVSKAPGALQFASSDGWYEDSQLKADFDLQRDLMIRNPFLKQTYDEFRKLKSDGLSLTQFNSQFWSTRTNMLRAHAVEFNQKKGSYNVLSEVKPIGDSVTINREQIQLVFSQHPLVKQVYDENVPKLNEVLFWERFFLSRLYKKLKGNRITESDTTDPTFDRYLNQSDDDRSLRRRQEETQIPHFIDLEGNEENQGGTKSGNRKDWTMRPNSTTKVPIIRSLNSVSERIMANVAPSDIDPANPIGMSEKEFNELTLRDLQAASNETRIELNIKEQSLIQSRHKSSVSEEARFYAAKVPSDVLHDLSDDVMNGIGGGLQSAIGFIDDSNSEDEDKLPHVGSKSSIAEAQEHLIQGVKARGKEIAVARGNTDSKTMQAGLSNGIFESLTLSHATTTEFLNQFWLLFLSGDADRAGELSKTVESLDRAMERINAVAAAAEKERQEVIEQQRQEIRAHYQRTQKRLAWNANTIKGGEKTVMEMMDPIIKTLRKALTDYKEAFAAQNLEAPGS
ncbi:hypothetical protein BJ878DRAFT_123257 [Calycina marina]|uniref:BSD domain-containing protein n=1 Tax=Calycina marina TaxID=1763456 RepID=A0A9P7Z9H7_9HELO|nr:hypothetical protein BJ878DRAFT_123257 [Calycina marina]